MKRTRRVAGAKRGVTRDCCSVGSQPWKRTLRRRLHGWFDRNARDLPWRHTRNPYRIWVSEIMLQQTQVATVCDYYRRFVRAFPTIRALAQASEDEVLRLWEGLGYYRRARQLHRAAKIVVSEYRGRFPREATVLRSLPGIGRYTAGAILSIAFDQRQPILEANTVRVVSRLAGYRGDPGRATAQKRLWSAVEDWLPQKHVGQFNQALMELGSEVCRPREPRCASCPVASLCRANAEGLQAKIPPPARRAKVEEVREAAVVVRRNGRVLLVRRGEGERFAGLWDFPRFALVASRGAPLKRELADKVAAATGLRVEPSHRLTTLVHSVTRFRITLDCHEAQCLDGSRSRARKQSEQAMCWVRPAELEQYPLSVTGRKLSQLLTDKS